MILLDSTSPAKIKIELDKSNKAIFELRGQGRDAEAAQIVQITATVEQLCRFFGLWPSVRRLQIKEQLECIDLGLPVKGQETRQELQAEMKEIDSQIKTKLKLNQFLRPFLISLGLLISGLLAIAGYQSLELFLLIWSAMLFMCWLLRAHPEY